MVNKTGGINLFHKMSVSPKVTTPLYLPWLLWAFCKQCSRLLLVNNAKVYEHLSRPYQYPYEEWLKLTSFQWNTTLCIVLITAYRGQLWKGIQAHNLECAVLISWFNEMSIVNIHCMHGWYCLTKSIKQDGIMLRCTITEIGGAILSWKISFKHQWISNIEIFWNCLNELKQT